VVVVEEPREGYFSLVRWRADVARDEERNVGVLVLDPGRGAYFQQAPVSAVSQRLRVQGILDAALMSVRSAVEAANFALDDMRMLHREFQRSLLVSEPRPVAVRDPEETIRALYSSLVAVRGGGGSRALTKSGLTDSLVETLRKANWAIKRATYRNEFLFDIVVDQPPPGIKAPDVVGVVSYDAPRKDWTPIERDAGYFVCGVQMLSLSGLAAVLPPGTDASSDAKRSHERVLHILDRASVPTVDAARLASGKIRPDILTLA
jgi:hypothetical protein